VTGVLAAFLFLFLVASISGTNYTPSKIIQNAIATNGTTNTTTTSLPSTQWQLYYSWKSSAQLHRI
jgi:hypothetical protein